MFILSEACQLSIRDMVLSIKHANHKHLCLKVIDKIIMRYYSQMVSVIFSSLTRKFSEVVALKG